ncbi:ATP-binding protein [soil metagenome]
MIATHGFAEDSESHAGPTRFHRGRLAANADTAGQARADFDGWLQTHFSLTPASRIDLTLAVNEAVANAAEHAYIGWPLGSGTFDVDANYDTAGDTLTVIVEDGGHWQQPDESGPFSVRGRGIQLMAALADHTSIDTTAAGTRVSLTWQQMHSRPEI